MQQRDSAILFSQSARVKNKRDPQINRGQFYQAFSDSMMARLLSTGDTSITDELSILIPQPWPVSTTAEYGEVELCSVADVFWYHILLI